MSPSFLGGLESVFGWLLEASWQASVLAVLVLGLQWLLREKLNPRWHHALWLLVVARLLLPALPESALSLFQFAPEAPLVMTQTVTEPIFAPAPVEALPQMPSLPAPPPQYPWSAFTVLALIWLVGACGLLLLTWQVNRRFARHVVAARSVDDPRLLELAATAQNELGIRRSLRMIESAQVQSPAIMGLFRPTLILPAEVGTRFSDDELRLIFLHEFAHLKRGDLILQWVIALLQIMHWFNPILWYAFRRARIDREPATDALVLSCTGETQKESYGHVLVKLLEHHRARYALPTLVGILEDKDQFKRRFSLIARFTRGAYGWSLLGVLLIGGLSVACLTKGKASENPINPTQLAAEDRATARSNDLRLENLKVQDLPLDRFIEKISKELRAKDPKKQGLNFVLTIPHGEPPVRVSLDFTTHPSYRANIWMILDGLKRSRPIRYNHKPGGSIPGTIYIQQLPKDEIAFDKKAGSTLIDIDFSHADPITALQSLQAASASKGFTFDLDLKSISQLDALKKLPAIDLNASQISVEQALRSIFYLADLHPVPLEHYTGFAIQSQSPEATKAQTQLVIGLDPRSFTLGSDEEKWIHESLPPGWSGPSITTAAYKSDGTPSGFPPETLTQKIPSPNGDLEQAISVDPKLIDKVHLQVATTLEIKDAQGHSLGKVTGKATLLSGQNAVLTSPGSAAITLPGKGSAPGLGFVGFMQIMLVNEEGQPLLPPPTPPGVEIPATLASSASVTSMSTDATTAAAAEKNPELMIRNDTKIVQIDEDDYQAHRGEIDAAVQKGDSTLSSALKSYHLLYDRRSFSKPGDRDVMESVRVLPYARAFKKDADGKLTPTDFTKQYLGIEFVNFPTFFNDTIGFKGDLNITSLESWTQTEGSPPKPVFHVREMPINETFAFGQTKGFELPGGVQMEPADPSSFFVPGEIPDAAKKSQGPAPDLSLPTFAGCP